MTESIRPADAPPAPELPEPVRRFFAGVAAQDPVAVAAAFTADGVVHDDGEGLRLVGPEAVAGWVRDHLLAAAVQLEPQAAEDDGGTTRVDVGVSGAFPGSPRRSTMRFAVDGPAVADLHITPLR